MREVAPPESKRPGSHDSRILISTQGDLSKVDFLVCRCHSYIVAFIL